MENTWLGSTTTNKDSGGKSDVGCGHKSQSIYEKCDTVAQKANFILRYINRKCFMQDPGGNYFTHPGPRQEYFVQYWSPYFKEVVGKLERVLRRTKEL